MKDGVILIDIRTEEELSDPGYIEGYDYFKDFYGEDFKLWLDTLDKTKKYLIYCFHANRTATLKMYMRNKGFINVRDLKGGINLWISRDLIQ
jgi:rhodanese-related sulfurtransferase